MSRRSSDAAEQPRDLVLMRQRLDEWRGVHARGVGFPPALWSAAGRVAQRHGIFRTARALGLEYNKLKRMSGVIARAPGKTKRPSNRAPMKFIDCSSRWRRARQPRWCCSCVSRAGVHTRDPAHRADAHLGGGSEHRFSRRHRWARAHLPGAASARSILWVAVRVLQSAAHSGENFDV